MRTNWAKSLSCSTYHQRFVPNFYGLTWTLKLTIKAFLSLGLRVKTSILPVIFFHGNGKTKLWDYIKSEWNLESKLRYFWIQLTDALPKLWKESILNSIGNSINLCIFDCHLIEKNNLYCWEEENYTKYKYLKSTRNELYSCTMKVFQQFWFRLEVNISFTTYGNRRYNVFSFSAQNPKKYFFCE